MSLLCIDFGNTRVKWALFEPIGNVALSGGSRTVEVESMGVSQWLGEVVLPELKFQPIALVVSSVRGAGVVEECRDFAARLGVGFSNPLAQSDWHGQSCLATSYNNPLSLGQDRWSACYAVAFQTSFPVNLVVSFGTATTVDAVVQPDFTASSPRRFRHLGGYIVPGVSTMLQSLHQQTAQLPMASVCQADWPVSTSQAIGAGVFEAQSQLVIAARTRLQDQYEQAVGLWLTGGACTAFAPVFESPVFSLPDAVLLGLCRQFTGPSEGGFAS